MSARVSFGEFLRRQRVEMGITLREFCRQVSESPGNVSRIERGLLAPPDSREKLELFARVLGITSESEQREFMDHASIERGHLPKDILDDDHLYEALPLVFRTIRGQKLDEGLLRKLAKVIQES